MGAHKLLMNFGARPLGYWAVHHATLACVRVIVVVGHGAQDVTDMLRGRKGLVTVVNPEFRHGMLSSIACGAREVHTPRFFVAPADMPFITPDLFINVASALTPSSPAAIFPRWGERTGHPVLISSAVIPALLGIGAASEPHRSMRDFLRSYETTTVSVDNDGSIIDIDTVESLDRYAPRAGKLDP